MRLHSAILVIISAEAFSFLSKETHICLNVVKLFCRIGKPCWARPAGTVKIRSIAACLAFTWGDSVKREFSRTAAAANSWTDRMHLYAAWCWHSWTGRWTTVARDMSTHRSVDKQYSVTLDASWRQMLSAGLLRWNWPSILLRTVSLFVIPSLISVAFQEKWATVQQPTWFTKLAIK